jgi:hypothetical protein
MLSEFKTKSMTTIQSNRLPLLFLNRVQLNQEPCIKLYFHTNDAIIHRIKQNDWIDYSIELNAYYTVERKNTLPLLQDLFEDIAEVRMDKLNWKKLTSVAAIIGKNKMNYFELQRKKKEKNITIHSIRIDGKSYFMFKHFFKREMFGKVLQSGLFVRHSANNMWLIETSEDITKRGLYFLMKHYNIRLSKEIHISDLQLKRSLLNNPM